MDIGKAFTFVFEDDDWVVKVLIGIGILVAGIVLSWLVIPAILAASSISARNSFSVSPPVPTPLRN